MTTISDINDMTNTIALENFIQTWEKRVGYLTVNGYAEADINKAKALVVAAKKRLAEIQNG